MTDIMIDTETTHTDPEDGGLLQLAGIKFNYATGRIGSHFDRCPMLLPHRYWSDSTREFWSKHPKVLDSIILRQEPPAKVFLDFVNWVGEDVPEGGYRFWAKPTKFDWPFVESHLTQLGLPMPFNHWQAVDLNTFISGLRGSPERVDIGLEVPFKGSVHNALHDCAYQIDCLMYAKSRHVQAELA